MSLCQFPLDGGEFALPPIDGLLEHIAGILAIAVAFDERTEEVVVEVGPLIEIALPLLLARIFLGTPIEMSPRFERGGAFLINRSWPSARRQFPAPCASAGASDAPGFHVCCPVCRFSFDGDLLCRLWHSLPGLGVLAHTPDYRGLTAVLDGPWLILAYLIAIGWLAGGSGWVSTRGRRWAAWVQPITYLLIIIVVVVAYIAAISAGVAAANLDLSSQGSRLPVIRELKGKDGATVPFAGFRMLFAGKDTVIVFKPAASTAESPFIHLLKRDDTGEITLTR